VRRGDHGRSGLHRLAIRLSRAHRFTESEPDRVPGLAANECAGNAVGFDCSALRSRKMKPPGAVTAWKASGVCEDPVDNVHVFRRGE